MKKLLSLSLLLVLGLGASAQGDELIESIYREYSGNKLSLNINLGEDFLDDIDLDIDTDELRQNISGEVRKLRFIKFDDFAPALRNEKEIIERLFAGGYEYVPVEKDWDIDEDTQILIFKKAGTNRTPHLILMINDRDDREALMLIFSGQLEFKTDAL